MESNTALIMLPFLVLCSRVLQSEAQDLLDYKAGGKPKLVSDEGDKIAVSMIFFSFQISCKYTWSLCYVAVDALRAIGAKLGKKDWDFSVDPCSNTSSWLQHNKEIAGYANFIECNCPQNTSCHVSIIRLKSQSLPGILPPELVKLPYLQEIDLSRNYLEGPIPKEWGSMQLVYISLGINRLSGRLPPELGSITTLKALGLYMNQFSGPLPPELGSLSNLERMVMFSNGFSGSLPESFVKLTSLTEFKISDNNFSGKIPNFVENWINLTAIWMQASGLEGPIPLGISFLTNLSDLRISDIYGAEGSFPQLSNMTSMETLILRSCNITGEIPTYLGNMTRLETLDLSFNKLTGPYPRTLGSVTFIYLTGNALNGSLPKKVAARAGSIDLSYNDIKLTSSGTPGCQQQNANLFGSSSLGKNLSGIVPCLQSYQCPPNSDYSFHINCGGSEAVSDGRTTYDADRYPSGVSGFSQIKPNWVISSTGRFMDNSSIVDYTARNASTITMTHYQLYMTARLSPLSLTYYGFCLLNGKYTVKLHFAEIMFTNDNTFRSTGRRIFDIYIQGQLVLKDFNIEDAAGGVGKAIIKEFPVTVTGTTLEIRFYWAGKGTTEIPYRGVYGPLVSAISVAPDSSRKKLSLGTVVAIVLSVLSAIVLVLGFLWWIGLFGHKNIIDEGRTCFDLRDSDLQTGSFTLRQIKAATNNFDVRNKIGEGGFGSVYKGYLSDGTIIAVKQLSAKSRQGNREFVNEIGLISGFQHPNLVKLYGCCIEQNQLLLVYEYLEKNSLAHALFEYKGQEESQILDWPTRRKICVGLARALAFLHEESRLKIIHRDIKATNVLLDKNCNAKLSDFGLAKLVEEDKSHISTRLAGTFGYMAPEYAMKGYLSDKADVYSFGVVALEIVSGSKNTNCTTEECDSLLEWALVLQEKGDLMELVDPRLESNFAREEVLVMINVALRCTKFSPTLRPAMSSVVKMLAVEKFLDSAGTSELRLNDSHLIEDQSTSGDQTQSMSTAGTWTSTSAQDLYSMPDSDNYGSDSPSRLISRNQSL